jgi:hypothetical protein
MHCRFLRLFAVGLMVCALTSLTVAAQGNSQGKGKGKGHDKHKDHDDQAEFYAKYGFQPRDREIVTTYYSKRSSGLPPGLAKRNGNLPPGLEKQLERNGTLPPGLQKKLRPCPVEVERRLPPLTEEYRRGVIGAHIVVFNRNTSVIVDVMKDVVH